MNTPTPRPPVDYLASARRHHHDAELLYAQGCMANTGQLYGFVAECGLKALLLACGIAPGPDGGLPENHPSNNKRSHPLRQHMPTLSARITAHGQLIPDGAQATTYMAAMPHLDDFSNWSVDHRYWHDAALPLASVAQWRRAASEVTQMLDQAKQDGKL